MRVYRSFFLLSVIFYSWVARAQEKPQLVALKASESIVIDGIPDDEIWQRSEPAKDFYQYFPNDTSLSEGKTEIFVSFDEKNIYLLAICHDELKGPYQTPSLRRDYRGGGNDGISFIIDTYQDNTNAFIFGINPFGVMREGLISGGGQQRDSYSLSWDNKWIGASKTYEDRWVAELAIPLKTLRFKDKTRAFNMNFYRIDTKYNERSTWVHIPRNNIIFNLAFLGEVEFEEPLKKPNGNVAIIPYVSLNGSQDKLADTSIGEKEQDGGYGFGGDIKLAVSPSLNLDLTINPDFSQVEVDRQVTNLDRFEIFFPERRQFFLENADLFGNFGGRRTRPFFSRRIGVTTDTLTGQNISQPILFGARLSGKLSKNLRVGLMSMQTAAVKEANQNSLNYSVAVLQQKVFARSNIAAILVNKEDLGFNQRPDSAFHYNRVAGLEYNLASADNVWNGKAFYMQSFGPTKTDSAYSYAGYISYNKRIFNASISYLGIGENFDAEVGFVPRKGYQRLHPKVQFWIYPKSNIINKHGIAADYEHLWIANWQHSDHKFSVTYNLTFNNQAFMNLNLIEEYTLLTDDFDPTRTDGLELPAGSDYTYRYVQGMFRSDQRKRFTYDLIGSLGEYFNGNKFTIGGNIMYRFQPFGNIGLDAQYNNITLPQPYNSADLLLLGPRVDITFTRKVFLTGLFQYNNQIDNFNTNIRFQWRFKPVSDLYIVYTDNHYTTDFSTKNRSLVLKLTYWLNL